MHAQIIRVEAEVSPEGSVWFRFPQSLLDGWFEDTQIKLLWAEDGTPMMRIGGEDYSITSLVSEFLESNGVEVTGNTEQQSPEDFYAVRDEIEDECETAEQLWQLEHENGVCFAPVSEEELFG